MCGIIGYVGNKDPKGILLDGLKRLEYRGYDSAGIAIIEDDDVKIFRCEGRIHKLEERLGAQKFHGTVGLGHTRWATHGAPTEINAHPHRVGAVTLAQNGIIENYMEHKLRLTEMGRKIASETDSEIVAHLFDLEIQNGSTLLDAMRKVLPRLKGSYAFVILSEREPDVIIGVRNGAPLIVGIGEGENFIASDAQAILQRTNQIVYLEDHQYAVCHRENIEIMNAAGEPLKYDVKTLNWSPEQMEKSGFRHYMLKEIHEQPQALTQTIENNIDHSRGVIALSELAQSPQMLDGIERICIVACGTARHAGLIGKYYIEKYARLPVDVDFGSEFRYRDPILDKKTLLLLISQSGETADTLAALREGKGKGIRTLAICNVRHSSLTREADYTLYTNAGPEIGVASTKAFTTQLAVLYMLAVELGFRNKNLSIGYAQELTRDLLRLPILVDKALLREKQIEQIALEQQGYTFFFYMGRDVLYPIALEGALKLKEISYAHAEGYPAGELKHGPIALIDRMSSVLVLAPKDRASEHGPQNFATSSETIHEKMMSNLQEVKSRGGKLISVVAEGDKGFRSESHFCIELPEATWGLNPILVSIPMQMFAYYMALQRGTDVDKPRNLAKSVTVE